MANFKSDDGQIITEDTRKMKIERDGIIYKRIPRPKYKSRQARLDEVIQDIASLQEELEKIKEAGPLTSFDFSEVEALAEEMENWRDNLEGTSLENTDKYSEVSDCADSLRQAVDAFGELDFDSIDTSLDDSFFEELEFLKSELECIVSDLEGIYFPKMY